MKRFSLLFMICACAAGAYSQTQNFYQAASFHTNVFLHDLPAVPLHTRLSGYLTNESLWIAASNSVVRTNDTRMLDWTGATITIADASASNNPVTYGQLTNGLAEKSGTGTVAAIDGRVTTLEGQTNSYVLTNNATFLSVLKTMTNFTAVASSSNFLSYDPVTRTLSGCVTNAGSGTGSATNWYAYAQNGLIFRTIVGNGTNTLNANPTNSTTDFTLDWQGVSQYVGVDSDGRTNLIFKEYNVTYYGSGGTNWLWYYNLADFPHDQVPYAHMTNISTFPTGVWFKGDAGNASPVASGDTAEYDWSLTNYYGMDTNLVFVVITNGTTRTPLEDIDTLQTDVGALETSVGTLTGQVGRIEAVTSTWNTAATTAAAALPASSTNDLRLQALRFPNFGGGAGSIWITTNANGSGWLDIAHGTTSARAYRGDWGAAVSNALPYGYFNVYCPTNVGATNASGWNDIHFATERIDEQNWFSTTKYTPQKAGWYVLGASAYHTTATNTISVCPAISINGAVGITSTNVYALSGSYRLASGGAQQRVGGAIIYFNGSTDYAQVKFYSNQKSTNMFYANQTRFWGYWLKP